jgi:hypothetical protein
MQQRQFTLEFALDDQELKDFKKQTKVNLSTNLKIKLSIGKSDVKIDFLMKGKGKKTLSDNKEKIAQFVGERVVMRYIPAIRTSDLSRELVSNLLEKELYRLRQDEEYKNLIQQFIELQQPILDKISEDVTKTVSRFIPDVKEIKVNNNISLGRLFRASCTVEVDDGIRTDIKLKGDGVISLTAISLFRYISEQGSADQKIILLVEEPESHLHPNATHGLRTILKDISKQNQVVISTHSPIMIDRENVKHNILVQGGKAVNAKKLSEIRDSLGINLSDNLAGAYLVLLVEGSEDVVILRKLLSGLSSKIKSAFENGILVIDELGGSGNLGYKASLHKANICNVHAFMDNDIAGIDSIKKAEDRGILSAKDYNVSFVAGMKESEIEDLINLDVYRQKVIDDFGVDLKNPKFRGNDKKWSDRVKKVFELNGKLWSDSLEMKIKYSVATEISNQGISAINDHKRTSIDGLVQSLERKLSER